MSVMKNKATYKIAVIGAGIGGLAVASLLAKRGHSVTLYERNSTPGGKMQEFIKNDYRFDTGPSLLTMPFVLEKLFKDCGKDVYDYLSFSALDPLCRYVYSDGTVFDNHDDREKTLREITKIAPADENNYAKFLDYSRKLYYRTAEAFLFNPLYNLSDLTSLKLTDALFIDAFTTVSKRVDKSFESEYLRLFFKRFTTYNGSSPFKSPATLNVIPHVEISQGGYYVKNGLYRVAKALEQLATACGADIRYNESVGRIETNDGRITGLQLESGEEISYDVVISNSDASDTILNLISENDLPKSRRKKQKNLEPSCSGFVLMLGVNKRWDKLVHHNIFFSADYENEFHQIFDKKMMPDDPTIYVANTSFSDKDHAPEGCSNLFILVNAPYTHESQNWDKIAGDYPDVIIHKLEKAGLTGLKDSIQVKEIITPRDFYCRYKSNHGSIYGTSSNSRFAAFMRPRNKVKEIDGLYMVGGSTHPGGGIPLVILSAMHAAELFERDLSTS